MQGDAMRTGRRGITRWEIAAIVLLVAVLWLTLRPMQRSIRGLPAAESVRCMSRLKFLGLALHNYHDKYGSFPAAVSRSGPGAPGQSWRVLLLPHLDESSLYQDYELDEPWDSVHNSALHDALHRLRGFHKCPSNHDQQQPPACTHYLAVIGENTAWRNGRAVSLDEITDRLDETILLVEVADSDVNWFEPRDLNWNEMSFKINDPDSLSPGSRHVESEWLEVDRPYINVALADGSVRKLPADTPPDVLKALLTINGGEDVGDPWLP